MSQKEFTIDTMQLERLRKRVAFYPQEIRGAVKSTLSSGVYLALKESIVKAYEINPKKLQGTYTVRQRQNLEGEKPSIKYVVVGRRLSLTHFKVAPLKVGHHQALRAAILKGKVRYLSKQYGADNVKKSPFVMNTGAKIEGKERLNVFIGTGNYFNDGEQQIRVFNTANGPVSFMGRKEKLKSYRTVSVPQMLGNKRVSDEVQKVILRGFEDKLFKRISKYTGLKQKNVIKK